MNFPRSEGSRDQHASDPPNHEVSVKRFFWISKKFEVWIWKGKFEIFVPSRSMNYCWKRACFPSGMRPHLISYSSIYVWNQFLSFISSANKKMWYVTFEFKGNHRGNALILRCLKWLHFGGKMNECDLMRSQLLVYTWRAGLYLKDWVDELFLLGFLAGTMSISGSVRVFVGCEATDWVEVIKMFRFAMPKNKLHYLGK